MSLYITNTALKPINARAESFVENPTFRSLLKQNRCIVPANGFYEWKKTDDRKKPYFIHLKDKALFGFAGLYDTWKNHLDQTLMTYTIITTEPNELLSSIHNRMPVILRREHEHRWLSSPHLSTDELKTTHSPYDANEMTAYPVSLKVNATSSEGENLIRPNTSATSWFT